MSRNQPDQNVVIVAALGSLSLRTRLVKFAKLYREAGYDIAHVAWVRSGDDAHLSEFESEIEVERITVCTGGSYGGTSSRRLLLGYARWAIAVFWYLLRSPAQNVHALGLESALPAFVAALVRKHRVVYDDADRFSLCHPMPPRLRAAVAWTERLIARRTAAHIIPGTGRYPDGLPAKMTIELPNWPSESDLSEANGTAVPVLPTAELTLYANGWIGDRRGAKQLLAAAKRLDGDERFHLVIAGRLTEDAAKELVAMSNVTFLGGLSQAEALAVYPLVDAVATMYDPGVEINRFAEPNKWGDCLELGVPILLNREVVTGGDIVQRGFALTFAWDGTDSLADLLVELLDDRTRLDAARVAISNADFADRSFDTLVRHELIPVFQS